MLASLVSAAHLPETALLDLQARHFAVVPSFLTPTTVRAICADMSRLAEAGKFEEAGVGSGDSNRLALQQRRCSTCHLYPEEAAAELCGAGDDVARQQLYDAIDSIRDSLSEFDDRPLVKTEGLYLDYPLGGFFKRHIDAAPPGLNRSGRRSGPASAAGRGRCRTSGAARGRPRRRWNFAVFSPNFSAGGARLRMRPSQILFPTQRRQTSSDRSKRGDDRILLNERFTYDIALFLLPVGCSRLGW